MGPRRLARIGLARKLTRVELDRFVQQHATTGRVLDLGAGAGPYATLFPQRIALDRRTMRGIDVVSDAHRLPFASGTFDWILCTEVLEHLTEPHVAIGEMSRVLRPGGHLLLTTRFLFPIHDAPADYYRFTRYGLAHLLRGFEMIELREENDSIGALVVLIQRLGFQTDLCGSSRLAILWHALARLMRQFSFAVSRQYGTSPRGPVEREIMTTGYYALCRRPVTAREPADALETLPVAFGVRHDPDGHAARPAVESALAGSVPTAD